jgi:hypothetical protein
VAQHHQTTDIGTATVTADDMLSRLREAARGWRIPPLRYMGLVSPTITSVILHGAGRATIGLSSGQAIDVTMTVRGPGGPEGPLAERKVEDVRAV